MHTPEQAKQLWCPMARISRHEAISYETGRTGDDNPLIAMRTNHYVVGGCNNDPVSCRCIADHCSMWRWASAKYGVQGYCGLAGIPFAL